MSMDPRTSGPNGGADGDISLVQLMIVSTPMLRGRVLERLEPRDRAAMEHGFQALERYRAIGLYTGLFMGAVVAARTNRPPFEELYAPGSAKHTPTSLRNARFRFAGRAGWFALGMSFLTRSIGSAFGLDKCHAIVQREGDIATVSRTARETVKDYERETRQGGPTADPRIDLPRRPTASSEAAQLDTFVADTVDDGNSTAWDQLRRSQEQSQPSADDVPSAPNETRWDALRKANAAEPSTWERIRQDQARSDLASRAQDDGGQDSAAADRERRQREFDALLEKERAGADGGHETRWR